MGNITDKCCNDRDDANNTTHLTSPANLGGAKSIAEVQKQSKLDHSSNFSDQAFQNIFNNNQQQDAHQMNKRDLVTSQSQNKHGASAQNVHFVNDLQNNNHPMLRKKSTLHGEILAGARPKLNSITIGFSMHAHNFPINANIVGGPQKKHSLRKRSKLHSMKPQHFEILSEKQNASEEEAKSANLGDALEFIAPQGVEEECLTAKQANLTDDEQICNPNSNANFDYNKVLAHTTSIDNTSVKHNHSNGQSQTTAKASTNISDNIYRGAQQQIS